MKILKCPFCKSENVNITKKKTVFETNKVIFCNACLSLYVANLKKSDIDRFYSKKYYDKYMGGRTLNKLNRIFGFHRIVAEDQINYMKQKGINFDKKTILEYGSGRGEMIEVLIKNKKNKIFSVEPDDILRENIKNKNKNAICLKTDKSIKQKIDIVIMSHMLEHVLDPEQFLKKLKKKLKKNSIVFIEVPNILNKLTLTESFNEPHISHMTPEGLKMLLINSNYKIISHEELAYKIFQNPTFIKKANTILQFKIIKKGLTKNRSNGEVQRIIVKNI